jgi:hypothetical protein
MKTLLLSLFLTFSFSGQATPVDGKIVYKLPNGSLVERMVKLEVPSRGQGEVVLSGKNFEWKTSNFWTVKKAGQTKFYAAFKTEFMAQKSVILFKGTYLKGTNKLLYYGDFYKLKGHKEIHENSSLKNFRFGGAFKFKFIR